MPLAAQNSRSKEMSQVRGHGFSSSVTGVAFIRRARTGSGATAEQIAAYSRGRQRIVEHVGSAHTEPELGMLLERARELLENPAQSVLELGVEPTPGKTLNGTAGPACSGQLVGWRQLVVTVRDARGRNGLSDPVRCDGRRVPSAGVRRPQRRGFPRPGDHPGRGTDIAAGCRKRAPRSFSPRPATRP